MTRLVIDPVPRVGGHLRVEVELAYGVVDDAWVSGTMYRGLENVLRGRDIRDAWLLAERACGVCSGVHGLASARAVEDALGARVPRNARLVRNLLAGAQIVQDAAAHFYLRAAPDWVDAQAALNADLTATASLARSLSDWPNSSASYFSNARDKLAALVGAGPLATRFAGHPAYDVPPELSLLVLTHYLEALDWQRGLVRLRTILGGKSPHPQTYLVGGMAVTPEWGGPISPSEGEHPWRAARHSPPPLSADGLMDISGLVADAGAFVTNVLVPDVCAVLAHYQDWETMGLGHGHFLSYGDFPLDEAQPARLYMPRGRVMDRDLSASREVDPVGVAETVSASWYAYPIGTADLLPPFDGVTEPRYAGPQPPYSTLEGSATYSWVKAPRYDDDPMEVGPLARLAVARGAGATDATAAVDEIIARLKSGSNGLFGSVGRTYARAIEARLMVGQLDQWLRELVANLASGDLAVVDLGPWDSAHWPDEAKGCGVVEAPGGAVGHWLTVRRGRIADYQIVDASTWNASPRDNRGRRGTLEQALVGTPVADPQRPLEILRTIHSFDPCATCAVH